MSQRTDRNADVQDLEFYQTLSRAGELTLRINVARSFNPYGSREEIARRMDALPGADGQGGPTGKGGIWVRIACTIGAASGEVKEIHWARWRWRRAPRNVSAPGTFPTPHSRDKKF